MCWPSECSPRRWSSTRSTRAPTPALPIAIPFSSLHYNEKVSLEGILANSAKALDLESGLAEAHASRGLALSIEQRYPEAEAEFELAIAGDPNLFEARISMLAPASCKESSSRQPDYYERAAEIKPDDYQSVNFLQSAYRSLGRPEQMKDAARRTVERAESELARNPENPRPAYLGANALAVLGDIERAREWASRALAIDPDDILTQYNVACVYCLLGELDRALDLLERLLPNANHETKAWVSTTPTSTHFTTISAWQKVLDLTA